MKKHNDYPIPYATNFKIIISGNFIESFQYKYPVGQNLESDKKSKPQPKNPDKEKQKIHNSSISRTRQSVIRLINCNAGKYTNQSGEKLKPYFVSLTFRDNVHDITTANEIFTNFMKRLNYHAYKTKESTIDYLTVIEFQYKRARKYNEEPTVHFHTVFFNLPLGLFDNERETRAMAKIWNHGFVDVKEMDDAYSIGLYIGKYLTKEKVDEKLKGRKRYFRSRNLNVPQEYSLEHHALPMTKTLLQNNSIIYHKEYNCPHQGPVRYRTFVLSDAELEDFKNMYNAKI